MRYSDVDSYVNDLWSRYTELASRLQQEMNDASQKMVAEALAEFSIYQRQRIAEIFHDAVQTFYDSYDPEIYQRHESMYDLLDMKYDRYGCVVYNSINDLVDVSRMTTDRKGGDLFKKVFQQGWHGGAEGIHADADVWGEHPESGTPYYRRPGRITLKDGTRKWHRWGLWGKRAVQTVSPETMLYSALVKAETGELHREKERIVREHNDEMMQNIRNNVLPRLKSEIFS